MNTVQVHTRTEALAALRDLETFIGPQQRSCLKSLFYAEEHQHFIDLICNLAERVKTMPQPYQQDGKDDEAIVYLHYFKGGCDWHITERDSTPEQMR